MHSWPLRCVKMQQPSPAHPKACQRVRGCECVAAGVLHRHNTVCFCSRLWPYWAVLHVSKLSGKTLPHRARYCNLSTTGWRAGCLSGLPLQISLSSRRSMTRMVPVLLAGVSLFRRLALQPEIHQGLLCSGMHLQDWGWGKKLHSVNSVLPDRSRE